MFNINKIYAKIKKCEVISFDIFDTLLLRPYIKPTDLFLHIEKLTENEGYAKARILAEYKAREKNESSKEDITLEDIYEQIHDDYKNLKDKELELEYKLLQVNPEMKKVYDYAKSLNKKIIITSDMYLSKQFLEDVLRKNEYDGYSEFYLSSDIGLTKWTGTLYKHIIDDLKISPKKILHIGDNYGSDYKKAKKLGITTFYYPKAIDHFFEKYKSRNVEYKEIGYSILVGTLAINMVKTSDEKNSFWREIGYNYGGVTCYAYMKWLEKQVKKDGIKDILFVARDGYSLQKVFDTFNTGIKTHYVYAPRFLNLICLLNYDDNLEKINTILDYYKDKSEDIKSSYKKFKNIKDAKNYFDSKKELLEQLALKETEKYREYILKHNIDVKHSCSVDTFSWMFSAQKLIKKTLGNNLMGYYWQTANDKNLNYSSFFPGNSIEVSYFRDWNFMELLMTAPEYPVENVDTKGAVYKKNISKYEIQRKEIYPLISDGIVQFANDMNSIFEELDVFFEYTTVKEWLNLLADAPTDKERQEIYKIRHAIDSGHCNYIHLFPFWHVVIYLFGFIHIGHIKKSRNREIFYLFGVPLLKKKIRNNSIKYYLFGFIYFLKIKEYKK